MWFIFMRFSQIFHIELFKSNFKRIGLSSNTLQICIHNYIYNEQIRYTRNANQGICIQVYKKIFKNYQF